MRTFRHAVSLDERRAKFKANLWNRPTVKEAKLGVDGQKPQVPLETGEGTAGDTTASPAPATPATPGTPAKTPGSVNGAAKKKAPLPHKQPTLRAMERKYSSKAEVPTDIEEVWFAGCHCGTPLHLTFPQRNIHAYSIIQILVAALSTTAPLTHSHASPCVG